MKFKLTLLVLLMSCFTLAVNAQQNTPVTTIPFEMVHGSIVLKVKLNNHNRVFRLLFDTGADGMALEKTLADSIGLKITRSNNASVVGGSMKIDISGDNDVTMENGFVLKHQPIAVFPQTGKDLDGIIGNTMTRSYITRIDFNKKELSLYNFEGYEYEKGGTVVPVTIPSGVFIIPGNVEIVAGKSSTGNFVFDTGASYNLICFRPFVKQNRLLVSGFSSEYAASTVSMGIASPTFNGKASSFSFTNMPVIKDLPVTLMAGGGQNESWNPGFDGSIGMGIISRYNFTINRKKNEIYFMPNHTYTYPQSFTLGSYLLGFNLNGQLEVISSIRALPPNENQLEKGTLITQINGANTADLLKNAKKLEQLKKLPANSPLIFSYTAGNTKKEITLTK